MLQMKKQFADSFEELKNLRTLVMTALFIAIAVVLGFFHVQLTENLKFGFSFIANELTAMMFGPVVGGVMAGFADIIKYLLKPTGPFFFGFTFNAILGAVIYGMMLYKKPISFKRILASKVVVAVVVISIKYILAFNIVRKCIFCDSASASAETDHHGAATGASVVYSC